MLYKYNNGGETLGMFTHPGASNLSLEQMGQRSKVCWLPIHWVIWGRGLSGSYDRGNTFRTQEQGDDLEVNMDKWLRKGPAKETPV